MEQPSFTEDESSKEIALEKHIDLLERQLAEKKQELAEIRRKNNKRLPRPSESASPHPTRKRSKTAGPTGMQDPDECPVCCPPVLHGAQRLCGSCRHEIEYHVRLPQVLSAYFSSQHWSQSVEEFFSRSPHILENLGLRSNQQTRFAKKLEGCIYLQMTRSDDDRAILYRIKRSNQGWRELFVGNRHDGSWQSRLRRFRKAHTSGHLTAQQKLILAVLPAAEIRSGFEDEETILREANRRAGRKFSMWGLRKTLRFLLSDLNDKDIKDFTTFSNPSKQSTMQSGREMITCDAIPDDVLRFLNHPLPRVIDPSIDFLLTMGQSLAELPELGTQEILAMTCAKDVFSIPADIYRM